MLIKGVDKFRKKLPALSGKKIIVLPIYAILMCSIAFAICIAFDALPAAPALLGVNQLLLSFFPLFGVLIVLAVGFCLIWQMWIWRDRLKAKYGPTSYQRVIPFGFGGVLWIFAAAVNPYVPFYSYAQSFWASAPLQFLAIPLENFMGIAGPAVLYARFALAASLTLMGIMMIVRALQVFGIDYMAVVYLYFPEESQIQENEIYSALRHPTYTGILTISLGGVFAGFTLLSFVTYLALLISFYAHIHYVEEKELIQRFGKPYRDYMNKVPAFLISPKKAGTLLEFLLYSKRS
ncbi:MAG: hypothetical protein LUP94_04050 [Candidatus Methanomethylicus sp.]|nr:hypothetical protein [Candidatus Methanomethylicus sp.]